VGGGEHVGGWTHYGSLCQGLINVRDSLLIRNSLITLITLSGTHIDQFDRDSLLSGTHY